MCHLVFSINLFAFLKRVINGRKIGCPAGLQDKPDIRVISRTVLKIICLLISPTQIYHTIQLQKSFPVSAYFTVTNLSIFKKFFFVQWAMITFQRRIFNISYPYLNITLLNIKRTMQRIPLNRVTSDNNLTICFITALFKRG